MDKDPILYSTILKYRYDEPENVAWSQNVQSESGTNQNTSSLVIFLFHTFFNSDIDTHRRICQEIDDVTIILFRYFINHNGIPIPTHHAGYYSTENGIDYDSSTH